MIKTLVSLYYVLDDIFILNFFEIKNLRINQRLVHNLDLEYLNDLINFTILRIESICKIINI